MMMMMNKCEIFSLSIVTLFQNEIQFSSNRPTITEQYWNIANQTVFLWLRYELLLPSHGLYYTCMTSLLMSWRNIILPFLLLIKVDWHSSVHCLLALNTFASGLVCRRASSTTLLISGANVFVAEWKRVAVTSNICCNIVTGTCLI